MRGRVWIGAAVAVVAVCGVAVTARLEWPSARLGAPGDSLAHVVTPVFSGAGHEREGARRRRDEPPRAGQGGDVLPVGKVASGERADRRSDRAPARLGRLARRAHRAPHASRSRRRARTCVGRWLQIKRGEPVTLSFDTPVSLVSLGKAPARRLAQPQTTVPIGLVASGTHSAGAVAVAAAPRTWELLPERRAGQLVPGAAVPAAARRAAARHADRPEARAHAHVLEPGRGRARREPAACLAPRCRAAGGCSTRTRSRSARAASASRSARGARRAAARRPPRARARDEADAHAHVAGARRLDAAPAAAAGPARLPARRLADRPRTSAPATLGAELVAARSPPPGHFTWRFAHTPLGAAQALAPRPGRARSRAAR